MQKLVEGIHKFRADIFRSRQELFERLTGGQSPQALFITCSDSRIVPDMIMQADPGDLFVLRNAGNLVPPYGPVPAGGEAATIEYAVKALKIKDIIVCGHTRCGAMQALMNPDSLIELPGVRSWLGHAAATREIIRTNYQDLSPEATWKATVEENVLVQIENLRTHPAVAAGLARGDLKLHGWVYKIETGEVFAYDPVKGQFVRIDDVTPESAGVGPRRTTGQA